jgi:hypothetical protein
MAGYLDTYGVADRKRAQIIKRVALFASIAAVVGLLLFLVFHNFKEKRIVSHFLDTVRSGNYQEAYQMWGCTPATPCRDYSFEKFMEDWGPKGQYANAKAARVTTIDSCGGGVIETLEFPNTEPFGLWVDRGTKILSFAPWPRCPGRHWHFWEFIQRQFS